MWGGGRKAGRLNKIKLDNDFARKCGASFIPHDEFFTAVELPIDQSVPHTTEAGPESLEKPISKRPCMTTSLETTPADKTSIGILSIPVPHSIGHAQSSRELSAQETPIELGPQMVSLPEHRSTPLISTGPSIQRSDQNTKLLEQTGRER